MLQCPHCHNRGEFMITVRVDMRLTQHEDLYHVRLEGTRALAKKEYVTPDTWVWDDNDACHCEACGHDDPVWAFLAQ